MSKRRLDPRKVIEESDRILFEEQKIDEDVPNKQRVMTFMEMVAASYAPE